MYISEESNWIQKWRDFITELTSVKKPSVTLSGRDSLHLMLIEYVFECPYYSRKQDIFTFHGIQGFLEFYLRETQPKQSFSCNASNKKASKSKKLLTEGKTKSPKGLRKRPNRMSSDKMFLRKLAQQINDMDITGPWGESVTNKAIEAIEFLGKRDDFWNQIDTL